MPFQDTSGELQKSSDLDRARIPDTVPAVTGTTYIEKISQECLYLLYFFFALPFCHD